MTLIQNGMMVVLDLWRPWLGRWSGRSGRHIMMWRQLIGWLILLMVEGILLLPVPFVRVGLVLWWTNVVGFPREAHCL
jgi:hypothetical protein